MIDHPYTAYTTASHMVPGTRQVVMLFDGAIRYVQQAKKAIEEENIEARYNSLTKACDIIHGLQISIDFDNGGDIAQILYDYYAGIDMRLLSVHGSNDTAILDATIRHLRMMREAWEEIDQEQHTNVSKPSDNSPTPTNPYSSGDNNNNQKDDPSILAEPYAETNTHINNTPPPQAISAYNMNV